MIFWLIVGFILFSLTLFKKSSLPHMIMTATIAAVCYIGVLLFLTATVVKSIRSELHH